MIKGKYEILLLTPALGLTLLLVCLGAVRLIGTRPLPPDPARTRFMLLMDTMDRSMDVMRARIKPEPPLTGLEERFTPRPEPEAKDRQAANETPKLPPVPLVMTGVFWKLGHGYAIINRKIVGIGKEIAGYTLVNLTRGTAVLRDADGNERTLTLSPKEEP